MPYVVLYVICTVYVYTAQPTSPQVSIKERKLKQPDPRHQRGAQAQTDATTRLCAVVFRLVSTSLVSWRLHVITKCDLVDTSIYRY
ncbi:uncharacterized protein BDW47DRAFT_101735 [Aspergillus candidus]|uniref:Uncharacterized protein n=1 Tax=Aspergillus candidus TaxID=41067 RepID=A0A2I2FI50_ASPCN|nr:hypothetical protein BDW47DRAFT_101735 [Aspergillus candidus]PLB40294.1 hypothetical protein BDW47DRAFT_101735 [Aspergillus candidus]